MKKRFCAVVAAYDAVSTPGSSSGLSEAGWGLLHDKGRSSFHFQIKLGDSFDLTNVRKTCIYWVRVPCESVLLRR